MIGRHHVDHALGEPTSKRLRIGPAPQRRRDTRVRIESHRRLVRQGEMMRRNLRSHANTVFACAPDQVDGAGRGNMCDVKMGTGEFREADISADHDLFCGHRISRQPETSRDRPLVDNAACAQMAILCVYDHRRIRKLRIFENPPHHRRVHDGRAVVAEGHGARLAKSHHLRHYPTLELASRRSNRANLGRGILLGPIENVFRDGGVVVDGVGIRHTGHLCESARHRRSASARQVFLVFLPRLAQMGMHVDETGRDPRPFGVQKLRSLDGEIRADTEDPTVFDQTIHFSIDFLARIQESTISNQQPRHEPNALPYPHQVWGNPRIRRENPRISADPRPDREVPFAAQRRCAPDRE